MEHVADVGLEVDVDPLGHLDQQPLGLRGLAAEDDLQLFLDLHHLIPVQQVTSQLKDK